MLRVAAVLCLVAGCMPSSSGQTFGDCRKDSDCASGATCTRTNECVSGTLVAVHAYWTVNGQTVTPAAYDACTTAGIDHLEVSFSSDQYADITYSPVECKQGQIYFNKMPPRLNWITVAAYSTSGTLYAADGGALVPGENTVDVDLSPSL